MMSSAFRTRAPTSCLFQGSRDLRLTEPYRPLHTIVSIGWRIRLHPRGRHKPAPSQYGQRQSPSPCSPFPSAGTHANTAVHTQGRGPRAPAQRALGLRFHQRGQCAAGCLRVTNDTMTHKPPPTSRGPALASDWLSPASPRFGCLTPPRNTDAVSLASLRPFVLLNSTLSEAQCGEAALRTTCFNNIGG